MSQGTPRLNGGSRKRQFLGFCSFIFQNISGRGGSKLFSKDLEVCLYLAEAYTETKDLRQAQYYYDAVKKDNPDKLKGNFKVGRVYYKINSINFPPIPFFNNSSFEIFNKILNSFSNSLIKKL